MNFIIIYIHVITITDSRKYKIRSYFWLFFVFYSINIIKSPQKVRRLEFSELNKNNKSSLEICASKLTEKYGTIRVIYMVP